jgi:hypothetical protein
VRGRDARLRPGALPGGAQTPVFFGSAISNFGVEELLAAFVEHGRRRRGRAPPPRARWRPPRSGSPASSSRSRPTWTRRTATGSRSCASARAATARHAPAARAARQGPAHRRRADLHGVRSRARRGGLRRRHHRLHNHGTINIGDTFTEGEALTFTGIPNFAPEIFRRAVLKDPLRMKALQKGLDQLCEEGATQVVPAAAQQRPDPGCGRAAAVRRGRLPPQAEEYGVQCAFEPVNVATARWVDSADAPPRRVPPQGARASRPRPRRRAGLPCAQPREPRVDAGALAGESASCRPASTSRPEASRLRVQGRKLRSSRRRAIEAAAGAAVAARSAAAHTGG